MLLPRNSLIAPEKIAGYLLARREKGDKSGLLALLGYRAEDTARLEADIRSQLLPREASEAGRTPYGRKFVIRGSLTGPNGRSLLVKSVWMYEEVTGTTKFITLYSNQ
jgi:hypothetical protein